MTLVVYPLTSHIDCAASIAQGCRRDCDLLDSDPQACEGYAMAALSLTCKQCNASLKSVKEAQNHGEATGHSQFEESTEPVKPYKTCRKQ